MSSPKLQGLHAQVAKCAEIVETFRGMQVQLETLPTSPAVDELVKQNAANLEIAQRNLKTAQTALAREELADLAQSDRERDASPPR